MKFVFFLLVSLYCLLPFAVSDEAAVATRLTAAVTEGAVCLDGSAPVYYYRSASNPASKSFYIHHEGGGWCTDPEDCYKRSKTDLGSSLNYPDSMQLGGGYFSQNKTINPMMGDWHTVYVRYCDGGSFSGDNTTVSSFNNTRLYYRGKRILDAVITDLLAHSTLGFATDVVISGCSAGGLATFLHVDHWADRLPVTARVVGLPDSGFFLDYQSPAMQYRSKMQWVFTEMNATSGVHAGCISHYGATGEQWKCMFAQYTSPFIRTPLFPLQSEFDAWQIPYILGSESVPLIQAYGEELVNLLKVQLLFQPQHGIFLDSCRHHCGKWGELVIDGSNQAQAFAEWYAHGKQRFFVQGQQYPCQTCCHP